MEGGGGVVKGCRFEPPARLNAGENGLVGDRGLGVTGAVRCLRGIMGTGGALAEAITGLPVDGLRNEPVRRPTISDMGLLDDVDRRLPMETWLWLLPMDKSLVLMGLTGLERSATSSDADLAI